MKRCPQCGREYDLTMSFCLDDGSELLYGPASGSGSEPRASAGGQFDEPQTAILHETARPNEAATLSQVHMTEPEPPSGVGNRPEKHSFSSNRAARPLIVGGALVLLLVAGFFGYRYFSSANVRQIESIAVSGPCKRPAIEF